MFFVRPPKPARCHWPVHAIPFSGAAAPRATRRSSEECLSIAALIRIGLAERRKRDVIHVESRPSAGLRLSHLAANSTCKNSVPYSVGLLS